MTFPPSPSPSVPRDSAALQARIDAVKWYHEFDFGDGLKAQSAVENLSGLREVWRSIERSLDAIAFSGKTVLDVGTWDGFWSFYAERRGAASVLATDDATQNWSAGAGLMLAHELLASRVEVRQDLPIYDLAGLRRTFDVILCLGVFYHLRDPLYGFAQLRHCCHPGTVVVIEGELAWNGVHEHEARYFYNSWLEFLPSPSLLRGLLRLAYLDVESMTWMHPFPTEPSPTAPLQSDRAFLICRPFAGVNDMYLYRPHFGLHTYDTRWA
jgi:tRNA (mo5U34)-methyltransferase